MVDHEGSAAELLRALLHEERIALREGRLDALPAFGEGKERLMRDAAEADPEALEALRADLDRNAGLLAAAAEGIASVRQRIAEIRRGVEGLTTYAADGKRENVGSPIASGGNRLERRA